MDDSDIESDGGTSNDDEFSVMSNVDNEFDMTEDFSIHTPSREKSNSSHDSSVWTDRSDDRPICPKFDLNNEESGTKIPYSTDFASPENEYNFISQKTTIDSSFSKNEDGNRDWLTKVKKVKISVGKEVNFIHNLVLKKRVIDNFASSEKEHSNSDWISKVNTAKIFVGEEVNYIHNLDGKMCTSHNNTTSDINTRYNNENATIDDCEIVVEEQMNEKMGNIYGVARLHNDNSTIGDCDIVSEEEDKDKTKIRKGSLLQPLIDSNKAVFISLDLEHGGDKCGITQLSAQLFRYTGLLERDVGNDIIVEETFDSYVKPPRNAYWNKMCMETTGLGPNDERIMNARPINDVWIDFCSYLDRHIANDERGVIVAWNGASCDMEWLYRITQSPHATLSFPDRIKYFIDPFYQIKQSKKCGFHPYKSKLESLSLGKVYEFMSGSPLQNAHSSIVDAKAQTAILLHKEFRCILKKKHCATYITDMFATKTKKRVAIAAEPERNVHSTWTSDNNAQSWTPGKAYTYLGGALGGSGHGPTAKVLDTAKMGGSIVDIFLLYADIDLWSKIATNSDKYANKEWVVDVNLDKNGNTLKKKYFKQCKANDVNRRHRQNEKRNFNFTTGYIIAWHGSLIYHGGKAGERESLMAYWESPPYGTYAPWIQNTFPRDAWLAVRSYLHLVDNSTQRYHRVSPRYDPLFKVRSAMDHIVKNMQKCWIAGMKICIDESMIKYMGRAISFVQYMPLKPIKHGIKVFAACCAYTGHVLCFEVYLGKGVGGIDSSALEVVDRLLRNGNLITCTGRILYTDNWYTSTKLAFHLYNTYKWLFVGTIAPTEKKNRQDYDIPFQKLSKQALEQIPRGWSRRATVKIPHRGNQKQGMVQVTTWKDKKQVMFVHTHLVEPIGNNVTKRYVKGKKGRVEIDCPSVVPEYSKFMNGVDRNDRDSRDNSVSIRTNRWYLRIWFWLMDRVCHCTYISVCNIATKGIREDWKKYLSKQNGRKRFQIDLGLLLMEYGIRLDWKDVSTRKNKPKWMRQTDLKPCNCRKCFFCKEEITNGIYHLKRTYYTKKEKECSGVREPFERSSHCCVCWRTRAITHPSESSYQRRLSMSKYPKMGCVNCNERVCKECWPTYDHPNSK